MARLNVQICRHSPASRFITLFYGVYTPATGALTYVNAGQNPPLIRRRDGRYERLGSTGVALGMFEGSAFGAVDTMLGPGEMLVLYSDGITEAENPAGTAVRRSGARAGGRALRNGAAGGNRHARACRRSRTHAKESRFTDDLTILRAEASRRADPLNRVSERSDRLAHLPSMANGLQSGDGAAAPRRRIAAEHLGIFTGNQHGNGS